MIVWLVGWLVDCLVGRLVGNLRSGVLFSEERERIAPRNSAVWKREKKEHLIELLHELSAAPCLLRCRQSCRGPLRKQARYFREVNRSRSWFVIGGFRSILLVSAFG